MSERAIIPEVCRREMVYKLSSLIWSLSIAICYRHLGIRVPHPTDRSSTHGASRPRLLQASDLGFQPGSPGVVPLSSQQVLQAILSWIPAGIGGHGSSSGRMLEREAVRNFIMMPVLKVLPGALGNWPSQCA